MRKYNNVWGNPQKAKILIVGADPTSNKVNHPKFEYPFGLKSVKDCKIKKDFTNKYFHSVFYNLVEVLKNNDKHVSDEDIVNFFKNHVCITNAIGRELSVETSQNTNLNNDFTIEDRNKFLELSKNKIVILVCGERLVQIILNDDTQTTKSIYENATIFEGDECSNSKMIVMSRHWKYKFGNGKYNGYLNKIHDVFVEYGIKMN